MEKKFIKSLEKFGEVHVENQNEVVIKTKPFHTLIAKHGPIYIVYGPSGIYKASSKSDVIRALKGQKKPDVVVHPAVIPFLESLKTDVKLLVNGNIVARVPEVGRDLYITIPEVIFTGENKEGIILIMSTRVGENSMLNDGIKIPYAGYMDAIRKLASVIVAINNGDIKEIYKTKLQ